MKHVGDWTVKKCAGKENSQGWGSPSTYCSFLFFKSVYSSDSIFKFILLVVWKRLILFWFNIHLIIWSILQNHHHVVYPVGEQEQSGINHVNVPAEGIDVWEIDASLLKFEHKIVSGSYCDLWVFFFFPICKSHALFVSAFRF